MNVYFHTFGCKANQYDTDRVRQAFDLSGALDRPVAPTGAGFEVAVAGGYTQGVGGAGAICSVEDLTGPGGAVELQLAYRRSERFSTGVYGTLAWFRHGPDPTALVLPGRDGPDGVFRSATASQRQLGPADEYMRIRSTARREVRDAPDMRRR